MTLVERIDSDLKEAMKARNESALSTIRLVRAALKNKQIDLGHPLTDEEAQQVIRTMVKQYSDALQDFTNAHRMDLADRQREEIELLKTYLPAQLSDTDIDKIVTNVLSTMNASPKDMGRVMGAVMKEISGRADGNAVKTIVTKRLA